MPKMPPIPEQQKSGRGPDIGRRDAVTELQSSQPGDADANLDEQGRFGNIRQNLTNQHKVQDR
jgi:hypothetical protein